MLRCFKAALCLILCPPVFAQLSRVNGALNITVTDSTGRVVPGAEVAVSIAARAFTRSTRTDSAGAAFFNSLPDGLYTVSVSSPGFAAYRGSGVNVSVGSTSQLTVRLQPAGASQQVEVKAQAAALDPSDTSPSITIDRERIEELPVESRNYLSFTLLSPAASAANPALAQQQPGVEASGFSFGGLRPSSNAVFIDGVGDNDEFTGESRTELSPEAISEFQIVNHGYAAESGGAAGGSIDVETRSGTNLLHGDAFIFEQNGALDATPPLEAAPYKPDLNAIRAGLSAGRALRRDKTFGYFAAEQEYARGEDASDLSPQVVSAVNSATAAAGPLHGLSLATGFFPTINQQTEFTVRGDHNLTPRNQLMLRYAMTNTRAVNDAFGLPEWNDLSARGTSFLSDNALIGGWTSTLNDITVNELRIQAATRRADLRTGSRSGPGASVAGLVHFGTPFAGNSLRHENHFELYESISHQHHAHLLKAGIGIEDVRLRAAVRDGFNGFYAFADLPALAAAQPSFFVQSYGNPDTSFAELRTSAYAQDHWTAARTLVIDYGVRYDRNALPQTFNTTSANFSPRIGLAWTPATRWVIRSGFGTFFDRYELSAINRALEFSGAHAYQQVADGVLAAAIYRAGGATRPVAALAPSVTRPQPGLANSYSEVASAEVEHQISTNWTATASYHFVRGLKLARTLNVNLAPPLVANLFGSARLDPAYDAINQFQNQANSLYNGASFTVDRRLADEFELTAGYTYSKTIDDASYATEQPQNPYNLPAERAPSLLDQRHRFALSGLFDLPFGYDPDDGDNNPTNNFVERALANVEVAGIALAGSGYADNPLTGIDSNAEHIYPFAARPAGYGRNSLRTPANLSLDLRILKTIPFWRGHLDIVAESFNLINHQNIDLVNPVYGTASAPLPGFTQPLQAADPRRVQFSLDFEY